MSSMKKIEGYRCSKRANELKNFWVVLKLHPHRLSVTVVWIKLLIFFSRRTMTCKNGPPFLICSDSDEFWEDYYKHVLVCWDRGLEKRSYDVNRFNMFRKNADVQAKRWSKDKNTTVKFRTKKTLKHLRSEGVGAKIIVILNVSRQRRNI